MAPSAVATRRVRAILTDVASVREPGREAADERAESTTDRPVAPTTVGAPATPAAFVTASHEALFAAQTETSCDACGRPLAGAGEAGEDGGFGLPGEGVYLWARGDEVRLERAPLCPSCASAIGVTALARWEIEEEEG
jgi:hypothetical protein